MLSVARRKSSRITDEHAACARERRQAAVGRKCASYVVGICSERLVHRGVHGVECRALGPEGGDPRTGAVEPHRGQPKQSHMPEERGGDASPHAHVQQAPQTRAAHGVTKVVVVAHKPTTGMSRTRERCARRGCSTS